MPFRAKSVADYFIGLAMAKGESLTPMKIQKLVYFAHGWHLALKDEPLIDEQVEAWAYGPVIPSLYSLLRAWGNQPVLSPITRSNVFEPSDKGTQEYESSKEYARAIMDRVWDIYGSYSAIQLSNMTHEPDTPWSETVAKYKGGTIPKGTDIPPESIRSYFQSRRRSTRAQTA